MDRKVIEFDSSDIVGMLKIMDSIDEPVELYESTNDDGELVIYEVSCDEIIVKTFQKNGWLRTDTYDREGTCNEIFTPPVKPWRRPFSS